MAKRAQQESGEERVTAKSRLMMNLTARMPSIVSSSTSSNPGKTWYGYQDPGKSVVEDDQSGKPDRLSPTGYSKMDYDRSWSSQEWKSGAAAHDRSGKPEKTSWGAMQQICPHHGEPLLDGIAQSVGYGEIIHDGSGQPDNVNYQEGADSETFVMGSDAAEFVNKVKDMSNVAESGEEHSIIWRMFMAATMNAATFMGKNFMDIQNSIMNSRDLTLKHMFDITLKLVSEQDEINNLDKIRWEKNSWKQLSLIDDETVINLQRTKVFVFSDSVLCLGRIHQHPESNEAWEKRIEWITTDQSYRDYDGINGEPTEFEWNIFPGFTTLQLCGKVNDLLSDLRETPETLTGRILFMSMFNDISCDRKGNKEECLANARVVKVLAKKFVLDKGHLLVQVLKRSGILRKRIVHKELRIISRTKCCWTSQKADVLFSVQRLHCPGVNSRAKDTENCQYTSLQNIQQLETNFRIIFSANQLSIYGAVANMCEVSIHFAADEFTIDTIFRIILSVNQLSIYGAVANICEEFEAHQDRSGEPDVLMGQSIVLSEIKAEVPLQNENPSHHPILWQQYEERIKSLSQESKVSKFCMDAGFVHVVEVGQYFMTKDTGDFRQFRSVACREYTLHRDDESSQPRGWIQGDTRIGHVLEVTTSYLYGKYGVEIRIWSLSQDNSHSWVRISHGANKYVVDSNYNNTEVPADLPEEQASQSSVRVVAARSKAKAKPQKRETVELPSTIPMNERKRIDIEPAESSLSLRTLMPGGQDFKQETNSILLAF